MPSNRRTRALALSLIAGLASAAHAQLSPVGEWLILQQVPAEAIRAEAWVRPAVSKTARLDEARLAAILRAAPMEVNYQEPPNTITISLPMPDGSFSRFRAWESPIMEPGLAAQFPDIKTYAGQGIDDPAAALRFDVTPLGFHAQILSPHGAVYIDPYSRGDNTLYSVYYKRDYTKKADGWMCDVDEHVPPIHGGGPSDANTGPTLRTYRLACAATGEYTTFFGGTANAGQSAIVTAINRVSGVYQVELTIRLTLVANNVSIVYTNGATDPYTNTNGGAMLSQNQTNLDTVIGTANYDIGHVFSTGGGGVAGLGVVGINGQKARGVTGLPSPTGDAFYIDYVAHEMGHQFRGNHSFNSQTSNCGGGNRNAATAYEQGSGSTIMSYAGICGADNLQAHSDPYFIWKNMQEIIAFVDNTIPAVGTRTATGNLPPSSLNSGGNFTIPAATPFALTASGSDANGDPLTWCWEQGDLGVATAITTPDNGSSPLFRSFNPTSSPTRTFPKLSALLANTSSPGEIMPGTNRVLHFWATARDNRASGGGLEQISNAITTVNTGAAFAVTSPNTNVSWSGTQTVTWNVAGTTANGINCANVAILLSTDGGNTFPTTLLGSTPNDGSQAVTLPNINTSTARIKVAAVGNIFFDISNVNFTITPVSAPANDDCVNAAVVGVGSTPFTTVGATTDGPSEPGCNFPVATDPQVNQDIWFSFTAPCSGTATASLCGSGYDTKIAIYPGACPSGSGTTLACNDDSETCGLNSLQSVVTWTAAAGQLYTIRVGGYLTNTGTGTLTLSCAACYANCDASTVAPVLNANDFSCFLNAFAANDPYANCDGSTVEPILNANDFSCFLNVYAAGCP